MENTNKNLPRDVFMHLLSLVALAMSAINAGVLMFSLISAKVPDVLADRYSSPDQYFDGIRWAVAALIVIFPVLVWTQKFLQKDVSDFPEKRDLWIRRWALYLTLFVSALVIIGDVIALIWNFLQGEISLRFILKASTILAIAGSIFYYYKNQLKENPAKTKIFAYVLSSVLVVAIVGGLWVAGLPQNTRLVKIDRQRVDDLNQIQYQIVNFWQMKGKIPQTLQELSDPVSGFMLPTDPVTKEQYKYQALDKMKFKLCAKFETELTAEEQRNTLGMYSGPSGDAKMGYWVHTVGEVCFDREIDPLLFPLNENLRKPVPVR